jgi:hypothetical protein
MRRRRAPRLVVKQAERMHRSYTASPPVLAQFAQGLRHGAAALECQQRRRNV